jgi:predicted 2-oxoglutarate/Fe(II)-dependent dioxygenase YbiX
MGRENGGVATRVVEDPSKIHVVRLLDAARCATFIERVAPLPCWRGARSYTDDEKPFVDLEARRHWTLTPAQVPALFEPLLRELDTKFTRYTDPGKEPRLVLGQFALNRYEPGDFFVLHADADPKHNPERRYSIVLYLSDDFGGGGTAFPTIERTYKLSAGQALLFPSYYRHQAERVLSGTKYSLVFFLSTADAA